MSRKTIITISVVGVVVIFILGLLWWLGKDDANPQVIEDTTVIEEPTTVVVDGTLPTLDPGEEPAVVVTEPTLVSSLYYFVERWGTFSTVADFQNIKDIKGVVTDELYASLESQFDSVPFDQLEHTQYEGYTARVTSVQWVEQTDVRAEAVVTTLRTREIEAEKETYNQDIVIVFVNQGGSWKVSEATWK